MKNQEVVGMKKEELRLKQPHKRKDGTYNILGIRNLAKVILPRFGIHIEGNHTLHLEAQQNALQNLIVICLKKN